MRCPRGATLGRTRCHRGRGPQAGDPLPAGLAQLDRYLDRLGLTTGTLVIFDRRPNAPDITDRTALHTATTPAGHAVTLLRA
ncbi:hypothetical protein FRACA_1790003 [Frankia canadensis]|uniref:Uncharacterized protein n=1 Tax=Frankia canadensis TaxID=1836972 RepID=A0A2I2KNL1_9ACTN|nr:hypothetical protein [Frankia canadensis]SNQ47232.1 hypothetical protein FRACA_1790003 [Frankia canadensis]SOU54522.1 hypothetical protein FRACA_1790003 [Frankia canadensis]